MCWNELILTPYDSHDCSQLFSLSQNDILCQPYIHPIHPCHPCDPCLAFPRGDTCCKHSLRSVYMRNIIIDQNKVTDHLNKAKRLGTSKVNAKDWLGFKYGQCSFMCKSDRKSKRLPIQC